MTKEEAIALAAKYNLQEDVEFMIDNGWTPEEAIDEWDII